jgi:hypothetical protein
MIPVGRRVWGNRQGACSNKAHTLTVLGSPRNGEARWPDQVVDTMSAEGRLSRVDGLKAIQAWSIVSLVSSDPKSQNTYTDRVPKKLVERYFLFLFLHTG